MAGKQSLYEKQLQRIIDSMGADLLNKNDPRRTRAWVDRF